MKKYLKWFVSLAAIGSAIGLIIAYFCKDRHADSDSDSAVLTEDEDFDLDSDLKPVTERGYVPLNRPYTTEPSDESDDKEEPEAETTSEKEETKSE